MPHVTVAGIDPGISPAICIRHRKNIDLLRFECDRKHRRFDEQAVRAFLTGVECVAIEQVGAMANQGISSTAAFMSAWGVLRGICVGLDIPYRLVTPSVWKRDVLDGYDLGDEAPPAERKDIQKAAACQYVTDHFPAVNLIRGKKQTPDHNLAEAVCLSVWMERNRG